MENGKSWLKCRVSPGIIPGECVIETEMADGREISLFVTKERVKEKEGLLQVDVIKSNSTACLIYLPASPLEVSSRTITVPRSQVVTP